MEEWMYENTYNIGSQPEKGKKKYIKVKVRIREIFRIRHRGRNIGPT